MQLLLYTESIIVHIENLMESEKKRHNRINMLIHQDNEIQKNLIHKNQLIPIFWQQKIVENKNFLNYTF